MGMIIVPVIALAATRRLKHNTAYFKFGVFIATQRVIFTGCQNCYRLSTHTSDPYPLLLRL